MDLKRSVSAGLKGAISGPFFFPVLFIYLDWPSGAVRAHTGSGPITWGGQTWLGVGKFGSVEVPNETSSGVPDDFTVSLVCDFSELASYADAVIRQRPGEIYLGATTVAGGTTLLGSPTSLAYGTMDTSVLTIEGDSSEHLYRLTIGCTTGPGYRTNAAIHHSHEDQSRLYPNDTAGLRLMLAQARAEKQVWPEP